MRAKNNAFFHEQEEGESVDLKADIEIFEGKKGDINVNGSL
jgi:hypothetical protein